MWQQVQTSLRILVVLTILTGLVYPLTVTGIAQVIFPVQANGSLIYKEGKAIGSELIGQNFSQAKYFHGRPSAAGKDGYDAAASSGSNLGPTNQKLVDAVKDNLDKVRKENGLGEDYPVPVELVTASASGLDPDISPAAAYLQAERVAEARGLSTEPVYTIIAQHGKMKLAGVLGEPRINVLELNMALDALQP